jgi:hypothetical protein
MQHIQEHQGRGSRESTPVLLLDMLDAAFPGQMDEVQATKNRFDTVRTAHVQAQRQRDVKQALVLLKDVDAARIALQTSLLRLGISIIQYGLFAGRE